MTSSSDMEDDSRTRGNSKGVATEGSKSFNQNDAKDASNDDDAIMEDSTSVAISKNKSDRTSSGSKKSSNNPRLSTAGGEGEYVPSSDLLKRYKLEDRSVARIRNLLSMMLGCELHNEEVELERICKALNLDWAYLLKVVMVLEDLGVFRRTKAISGRSCFGAFDTDFEISFAVRSLDDMKHIDTSLATRFLNECIKPVLQFDIETTGFSWIAAEATRDTKPDHNGRLWFRSPVQLTIDGFKRILENDIKQAKQAALQVFAEKKGSTASCTVEDTVGFVRTEATMGAKVVITKKESLDLEVSIQGARKSKTLKTFEDGVAQLRLMENRLDELIKQQRADLADTFAKNADDLYVTPREIAAPLVAPGSSTFVLNGSNETQISVPHPYDGIARGQVDPRTGDLLARYQIYLHDTKGALQAFLLAPPPPDSEAGDDGTTGLSEVEEGVDAVSDDGSFSLDSSHQRQEKQRKRRQRRLIHKLQWEGHVAAARNCQFGPPHDRTGRLGGLLGERAFAFATSLDLTSQRRRERLALENMRTRANKRVRPQDPEFENFEPSANGKLDLDTGNLPAKFVRSWRPDMRNYRRMGHLKGVVRYNTSSGTFKPAFDPRDAENMSLRRDVRLDIAEAERRRNGEDINDEADAGAVEDALGYSRAEEDLGPRFIRYFDSRKCRSYYYDRASGDVQWYVPAESIAAGEVHDSEQFKIASTQAAMDSPEDIIEEDSPFDLIQEQENNIISAATEANVNASLEQPGVDAAVAVAAAVAAPKAAAAAAAAAAATAVVANAADIVPETPSEEVKDAAAQAAALAVATAASVPGAAASPLAQAAVMDQARQSNGSDGNGAASSTTTNIGSREIPLVLSLPAAIALSEAGLL
mmetsp:Transcript_5024/g.10441  ORF Transcript_5024/g.10441 Transcript_5024/m.10441 type:complete len:872 (-) Transcript_5024:11-2626(-)